MSNLFRLWFKVRTFIARAWVWGERAMQNIRILPEVLTVPTKIIIRLVIRVMARAIVDMLLSLLFVQNYLWNTEKKSITVLSSTAVCLLCYNYLSCTKLLEGGLLSEHE